MGRTPNDDRSDSMNPNNDAYWASETNRLDQTGGGDDDDYYDNDDRHCHTPPPFEVKPSATPMPITTSEPDDEVVVSVFLGPPHVKGLYLTYAHEKKHRGRNIKIDSPTIDAAIHDVQALWDKGGLFFVALYDQNSIYFEKFKTRIFQANISNELSALGDFQKLVQVADKELSNARRALDKHLGQDGRHEVSSSIRIYGAYKAANNALHSELAQKIQDLNERGIQVSQESLSELALDARMSLEADASAKWIRDFQQGRIRLDPLTMAFQYPLKISELKL